MDLKTFKILETLHPHGVGALVNISPTLMDLFPSVDTMDINSVRPTWTAMYLLLEDMKRAGLINYNRLEGICTGNTTGGYSWIDIVPVVVSLIQGGVDKWEAEKSKGTEERLRESMLEVNNSTLMANQLAAKNIKSQMRLTKTALWIAGISAFISLVTLFREFQSKSDKSQALQFQQLDSTLKNKGIEIKSVNQKSQNPDSASKPLKRDFFSK